MSEWNQMNPTQIRDMFLAVADKVCASEDFLTEIDLKIGDGDHGFGMALGFRAVRQTLSDKEYRSCEAVFQDVGMTLLDTMGGASGVLFGTMFISGSVAGENHEVADLGWFAGVFRRSLNALKRRGRAKVGDKTMVDALEPAVIGLEESAQHGASLRQGMERAAQKAKAGMEYTRECVAKFGRAKSYGEKSIGLQDAGATSVWIIFQAMSDWVNRVQDT